jgi:hypothetical protein
MALGPSAPAAGGAPWPERSFLKAIRAHPTKRTHRATHHVWHHTPPRAPGSESSAPTCTHTPTSWAPRVSGAARVNACASTSRRSRGVGALATARRSARGIAAQAGASQRVSEDANRNHLSHFERRRLDLEGGRDRPGPVVEDGRRTADLLARSHRLVEAGHDVLVGRRPFGRLDTQRELGHDNDEPTASIQGLKVFACPISSSKTGSRSPALEARSAILGCVRIHARRFFVGDVPSAGCEPSRPARARTRLRCRRRSSARGRRRRPRRAGSSRCSDPSPAGPE